MYVDLATNLLKDSHQQSCSGYKKPKDFDLVMGFVSCKL